MRLYMSFGICLVVCLAASGATGESLVNDTFDTDVADWSVGLKSTIVWDPLDADDSPESGSALVTNISDTAGDATGSEQCIEGVKAGTLYRASADILVPDGQSETGGADLLVRWYPEGCTGSQTGSFAQTTGVSTDNPGVWYTDGVTAVAPPGTQSARFRLTVRQVGASGTLYAHFDNVSFESLEHELVFVPAAGYAAGSAGSFWVTDLDVNNPGTREMTYELWWLPRNTAVRDPVTSETFALAGGESRRHTNVLGEVFDLDPADAPFGAIAVAAEGPGALAMARVFNQSQGGDDGTFGQSIPGVPLEMMITQDERRRILFMSETSDFRANVGCQNGTSALIGVQVELFDNAGNSLGTVGMNLPAFSNAQLNRVFDAWAPVDGYVDVWSANPGAVFYCYGSMIDNTSSDPTTVLPQ